MYSMSYHNVMMPLNKPNPLISLMLLSILFLFIFIPLAV